MAQNNAFIVELARSPISTFAFALAALAPSPAPVSPLNEPQTVNVKAFNWTKKNVIRICEKGCALRFTDVRIMPTEEMLEAAKKNGINVGPDPYDERTLVVNIAAGSSVETKSYGFEISSEGTSCFTLYTIWLASKID